MIGIKADDAEDEVAVVVGTLEPKTNLTGGGDLLLSIPVLTVAIKCRLSRVFGICIAQAQSQACGTIRLARACLEPLLFIIGVPCSCMFPSFPPDAASTGLYILTLSDCSLISDSVEHLFEQDLIYNNT